MDELYLQHMKARDEFWRVSDELSAEGLTLKEKDDDPRYVAADRAAHEAYLRWFNAGKAEEVASEIG